MFSLKNVTAVIAVLAQAFPVKYEAWPTAKRTDHLPQMLWIGWAQWRTANAGFPVKATPIKATAVLLKGGCRHGARAN